MALIVALAAVLAGGTAVALGATSTREHTRSAPHAHARGARRAEIVAAASSYLGLTPTQLSEQLRHGKSLAAVAAATPGKSEAELVAAITEAVKAKFPSAPADLETRVKAIVNRTPRAEAKRHARLGASRHGALRAAALSYLGLTRHELLQQLKSGKTLAEVADSTPGKSSAGLTEALLGTFKSKLDARVAAHQLSKSAETVRLTVLRSRISRLLSSTHTGRHSAQSGTGTSTTTP